MQALVAEMVGNFGKRLKPFGMAVKELTGDMNLSRAEIDEAQVCVSQRGLNRAQQIVLCWWQEGRIDA